MEYRAVTVSREYGSGGAEVAQEVARRLGWKVLDSTLIEQVAKRVKVDPELVRRYDERVDSWLHRAARLALWRGVFEVVGPGEELQVLDSETIARLAASLISEAHERGEYVMVGRGAQCVLHRAADVFHVSIYASRARRIERLRKRISGEQNWDDLMAEMDQCREDYIRQYFDCNWKEPHLYHLMLNSAIGVTESAAVILRAMGIQ